MANKKDKKRKDALKKKSTIEAFIFQVRWGFEKHFVTPSSLYSVFLETELDYIIELGLQEDLLSIKRFIDDIKSGLGGPTIKKWLEKKQNIECITNMEEFEKFMTPDPWRYRNRR